MNLTQVAAASQIVFVSTVLISATGIPAWRKRKREKTEKELANTDARNKKIDDTLTKLSEAQDDIAKQFGPNGNGMRQAINDLAGETGRHGKLIEKIDTRTQTTSAQVSELKGRLDQLVVGGNR
jgi:predicted  nucleic acid-binding Zn-ribbon protein